MFSTPPRQMVDLFSPPSKPRKIPAVRKAFRGCFRKRKLFATENQTQVDMFQPPPAPTFTRLEHQLPAILTAENVSATLQHLRHLVNQVTALKCTLHPLVFYVAQKNRAATVIQVTVIECTPETLPYIDILQSLENRFPSLVFDTGLVHPAALKTFHHVSSPTSFWHFHGVEIPYYCERVTVAQLPQVTYFRKHITDPMQGGFLKFILRLHEEELSTFALL